MKFNKLLQRKSKRSLVLPFRFCRFASAVSLLPFRFCTALDALASVPGGGQPEGNRCSQRC
jgi:hypothetical protein